MTLGIIVLAAGQGTRMRSDLPKVLHPLAGRPLLGHVLDTAARLRPARVVVVFGHGGDRLRESFGDAQVYWACQDPQLGTAHAVQQAMPLVPAGVDRLLVLYGDVPLTRSETLGRLLRETEETALGVLTALPQDPTGYGRIVRDPDGTILRIVEQKDASEAELEIDEVNTGIMVLDRTRLEDWLGRIDNRNAQGEYYLTDVMALAVSDGVAPASTQPEQLEEVLGINDRVQLAQLERYVQRQQAESLMRSGTTLADPARFDLRGRLQVGRDVAIDVNAVIEGDVTLGDRVTIGPNCCLKDCSIGADSQIFANSVIERAAIGCDTRIGPFSRIRPEAELADRVHVGNFVEIKKSQVGVGSKVNHLTYIGDCRIGTGTNVGAGTITCNYDGVNKHVTWIGDRAFIGSNTALVAPVRVEDGATIGAGSVITRDAPAEQLTLARGRQTTIADWKRPPKKT
jgi:bifunctional UDP-N-acetylglucosamine pyrophosphorylase/glucosamine-1-phosphate N-acetyltransferase